MRILVAVRQATVRSAVKTFLWAQPDLDVVGEASDSRGLLSQIEITRPDVLLLDWGLPGRPAVELLAMLRTLDTRCQIIVLGNDSEQRQSVLAAGADYFVSQGEPPRRLLTAVHVMRAEGAYA